MSSSSFRFRLTELLSPPSSSSQSIVQCLKERSFAVIEIDDAAGDPQCGFLHADELAAMRRWEGLARDKFSLGDDEKALSEYRSERGVMVGYRREDTREFFESRIGHDGEVEPAYLGDDEHTFLRLYSLYSKLAGLVLARVATSLGIDCREITDLTDLNPDYIDSLKQGRSGSLAQTVLHPHISSDGSELSSSLLRVCKYPTSDAADARVSFGAHTDTSFVTLGLASGTSGLEMLDRQRMRWEGVEAGSGSDMVVFTGEFLQVLSRGAFEAAAHRVVARSSERISCPFIVRGRARAVINVTSSSSHGGDEQGDEQGEEGGAVFNGVTMKLLHGILDAKRKRCLNAHRDASLPWVLSAYPMECPPHD